MTIESDIASIRIDLGRIADALEAKNEQQGVVADPDPAHQTELPLEPVKKTQKKVAKKKGEKKTVIGKVAKKSDTVEWTIPLLRAQLHLLQEHTNKASAKSLLKKYGASTLKQLDETKYARLASDIAEQLDE